MKKTLHIEGMHCSHCAGLVNIELYDLKEVVDVKVDIRDKTAIVTLTKDISDLWLINAIERAGYKVTSIS